jgi:hypothetical protein
MMRDCSKNRAGFDRVLMAVAATFITVSAASVPAQADPARNSAAELAIDAAIPRPEPANVPPPTASDFKADTTASVPAAATPAATKPADVVTAPAADTGQPDVAKSEPTKTESAKSDTATTAPASPPAATAAAPAAEPAKEPVKAASNVPAADQNHCAISTTRQNAPRWKNSTPRATSHRCGPRSAR